MKAQATSYPKSKIKILLLENISQSAAAEFSEAGYVEVKQISGSISEEELCEAVKGVHIIGIRSKTQITENVIKSADKLLAIGAFCIGTNQIDLKAATQKGVAVFNAPYSNTRSVAELVIGLSVMLIRRIIDKNNAAHAGIWKKDATGSFELRGKTLGIIGYGNIGSQVSVLAEAMGLNVIYYDVVTKLPHGNAKQVKSLAELLAQSDIITLHVPGNKSTKNLITEEAVSQLKKGSILLIIRGEMWLIWMLCKKYIDNGTISGAAIDFSGRTGKKRGSI